MKKESAKPRTPRRVKAPFRIEVEKWSARWADPAVWFKFWALQGRTHKMVLACCMTTYGESH